MLASAAVKTQSPDIDALISRVAQARDVVFIRNGSDHTAAEAAAHLHRKLAYRVRFADGHEVESAVWLRQLLREIRAGRPTTPAPTPTPH
jgi:lipoprotein-anchoring transpeptidase ErfK/SrfK